MYLPETKLYPPPLSHNHVNRPRLAERMNIDRQLTLVSAPAGYGKTEFVSAWLGQSGIPYLWLSLNDYDNEFSRFAAYLGVCLQRLHPSFHLELPSPDLIPYATAQLVNTIAALGEPLIWVLDDYHHITDPHIQQLMQFLLDNHPPNLHWVIITRADPPLEIPRLRVRQQLNEVRDRELRFNRAETEQFLQCSAGKICTPLELDYLMEQTEGWVASLQIVALALQEGIQDIGQFTGQDRYITDYLIAEVLAKLPRHSQDFLRQTSVLERLTIPLCNALTAQSHSQAILEDLNHRNTFLIPLDRQRQSYRYHVLFRQFLQTQLTDSEKIALHQKALNWYEANQSWEDAITHALRLGQLGAENYAAAVRLIESRVEQVVLAGSIPSLYHWLEVLPPQVVHQSKWLLLVKAWTCYLNANLDQAEAYLNQIALTEPLSDVLRCLVAFAREDYPQATRYAHQILERLPNSPWCSTALWILAEAQEEAGNIEVMMETLRQILTLNSTNRMSQIIAQNFLAIALNHCGKRREALTVIQHALEQHHSPVTTLLHTTAGKLFYEANQLAESRHHLEQANVLANQRGFQTLRVISTGSLVPLLYALGEHQSAFSSLETAYQLAEGEVLGKTDWLYAIGVRLYLQEGEFSQAQALAAYLPSQYPPSYKYMDGQIGYGRWLIAQNQLTDARQWLTLLEDYLAARQLNRWLVTVYLLQALVADRLSDRAGCRIYLAQAVQLAAPEGYFRAFLDEDDHLLTLLPEVHSIAPHFIDQLLAMADLLLPLPLLEPTGSPLDPLTPREIEVLHLVALGYSNLEIADKLVLAISTVKRHINNLYSKLGVMRRSQAILKAQQLNLI